MPRTAPDAAQVAVAVMAKAPVPGFAKTRLIAALGADGAADLQARLIGRAVAAAVAAAAGPVTLWCAPDCEHPLFQALKTRERIALANQPDGDLGARMHAAFVAAGAPALVMGVDGPGLNATHIRKAAAALRDRDAVAIPAQDGGYLLIGLTRPHSALFAGMRWSNREVMAETRRRLRALGLSWHELESLRDLDTPDDLAHWRAQGLGELFGD